MKQAKTPEEIPSGQHFAIILFKSESVFIPGDERSRTAPGHGYPAETRHFKTNEYWFVATREEWINEIRSIELRLKLEKIHYAALEVASKASVKIEVVVGVK